MNERYRFSVGSKLSFIVLLMGIILSATTIFFGYQTYREKLIELYAEQGQRAAMTAGQMVNWDDIQHYIATGENDAAHDEVLRLMRIVVDSNDDVDYAFVAYPVDDGLYFVYDTDETDEQYKTGEFVPWYDEFEKDIPDFLDHKQIEPIKSHTEFGWLLSIYIPFNDTEGNFAGYAGIDFSMDSITHYQREYLGKLIYIAVIICALVVLLLIIFIQITIVNPINKMAEAADSFLVSEHGEISDNSSHSLSELNIQTRDELESLAASLKSMETKIHEYIENLGAANLRAETDSLTGLHNRDSFEKRVRQFLFDEGALGEVHAFMMIDIDNFKSINDTFGHNEGDIVIQKFAQALRRSVRSSDILARIGGDEFALFCKNAGTEQIIKKKANELCANIRGISGSDDPIQISASIGVAISPLDGMRYNELYITADKALYAAKAGGRDQVVMSREVVKNEDDEITS